MDQRPNPDELLARVQEAEAQQARGKLKVFFGMAAGVGKTYAMLEAAQERRAEGVDVIVGWVDTHGRAETEALLTGLERLPSRIVEYRGTTLREFDLDAALARRPTLILVDELAHTNTPGSRHPKRWQDVEELLAAGINVYTTVNVQHLESLNDVVAQITGVIVRETVPDRILEQADEVELIDLPPDDLLQRLKEGKVYVPQQAERAIGHFFRKGNLIALRELALRRTADRVDDQMQRYMRDHAIAQTWPTAERILVCISPHPLSSRLVRATRRMVTALRAHWIVVYVETPAHMRLSEAERDRIIHTLRLAEQLGAETVTLTGNNVSEAILDYAHVRNVSKIVVGKPIKPRWRELLFGSVVDELVRHSGEIDVYVITGEHDDTLKLPAHVLRRTSNRAAYGRGITVVGICTVIAWLMFPYFEPSNLIMVYLLGVVFVATRYGHGPSILASVLSVAAFDFWFVPPHFTFAVADTQYLVTFAVMLLVALVISTLTTRLQQQAAAAWQRERRTAALYAMSRDFASTRGLDNLLQAAVQHISETFDSKVAVFMPTTAGELAVRAGDESLLMQDTNEQGVARWVYEHKELAGLGTNTLPGAEALYLPLVTSHTIFGVLGVRPAELHRLLDPEQFHLLETFANQTALAIERAHLAEETQQARVQIETERLRNSLLSSVSHDLRTPLATITGATTSLLDGEATLDSTTRRDLIQAIYEEAERLNRLVRNLLDMTRLESGAVQVHKEWQPLEEVVGGALNRLDAQLRDRPLLTNLPADLPLVPIDGVLIEQVLVNLLENALKYTPAGTSIEIAAWASNSEVTVEVADRGPGLPPGDEQRVFNKFYRMQPTNEHGVGLGLAICQAIIEAHGGRIWAANRPGGGAVFRFTLPLAGKPPQVEAEMPAVQTAWQRS
jgi:two-component system sensor histidine kinase KdpD